ncbi:uncharacterized protein LOC110704004 [Chenopodium quinoa]|uniref:Uncharacterized protein n=1 Tax=Chenopodium quinoa TaxID=63459 RepID=A0A803N836_CHEQI|nr:uncharacterized protein LOC110704004 [Chenopodium quinoa]
MAASTTTPTTFWDPEDWEIVNDDGFVYKRKKRRIDPFSFPRAPDPVPDPALQLKQRRKKKLATLRNLKEKYQTEICLWDNLSNTLKTMEDSAKSKLEQVKEKDDEEGEGWKVLEMGGKGSASVVSVEKCSGSLVDELLLQVEAQEAIIHSFEQLCDIAESLCNAQEEKVKEHYFNLPIWDSPRELMASLCED